MRAYKFCESLQKRLITKIDKTKNPSNLRKKGLFVCFKIGIDILSRALGQVPSAQVGLTSLFGMGRGDPHRNKRHKGI